MSAMLSLIDSVATIVDVRIRDELDATLAIVMHELVGAASLALWRVVRHDDLPGFQERVFIGATTGAAKTPSVAVGGNPSPRESLNPETRDAFDRRQYTRGVYDEGEIGRHVFPVMASGEVIGLVEIVRSPPLALEQERLIHGLIRIYRSHLGILENSETDELTGLSNRRPFDETFRRLAVGSGLPSRRTPTRQVVDALPYCAELAVLDIDHFKRVNDTFGHPYGDEVLVRLAQMMRDSFRETDRFFRFGGEEFVVVLPETAPDEADVALNRFRESISEFEFPRVGRITVSLGVTSIRAGETGSDAFGRADEALYVAKHDGRNQVRRYETLVAEGLLNPRTPPPQQIELF